MEATGYLQRQTFRDRAQARTTLYYYLKGSIEPIGATRPSAIARPKAMRGRTKRKAVS